MARVENSMPWHGLMLRVTVVGVRATDGLPSPAIRVERGVDYGCGKALDVYVAHRTGTALGPQPVVLLWRGVGPDERDVLKPLACAAAALGVTVFVPDWRSDAPDGGRGHLLSSVSFTREHASRFGGDADAIVLAGWSRGGKAAAGLSLNPMAAGGWRPVGVVCIAAGFSKPALITGTSPTSDLAAASIAPLPFWLVHGTHDPVVSVTESRELASLLSEHGWPVQYEELPTDHAGVVMAEYDDKVQRCRPAEAQTAIEAGRRTAETLHAATLTVGL
jgi:acetyl esterase/lipase